MRLYLLRRLLQVVPTVLMITLVVFVMMRSVPGDPVVALLGDAYTQEDAEAMREAYGLDRPLLVQYMLWLTTTLGIATAIIVEATLSFLGLGTQPPTPSWGWDLKANVPFIQANPWLSVFPGAAIFITVLGFNLFGDGLRDAFDPRLK